MDDDAPDTARTPKHLGTLPAFTPVPRLRDRSNGWKPHVQQAFIEALADTGSVASACRAVNRSTHGAYQLRRQPGAEEFAAAWEAALDFGMRRIEDVAMDRALNGVEVPVYSYGQLVGTRISYNDRLLMFMLRNRAPERFAEGRAKGLNAVGTMELERKKKEWRKEWEAERNSVSVADIRASIDRKVEALRQKILERERRQSPRVKRLREELEQAVEADRAAGYCPERDPEHELYDPHHGTRGRVGPSLPLLTSSKGESEVEEDSEEENPRWRSIKDEGWD
ncbi:hypothetical protein [Qipengyuania gelatinilytica]|uniref:Terminase n=1 Tax=Qipengyuania gelatinilytica TaxID=2867231 RepID=A0ABX9A2A4_9SPHN|nr:hypothetical protein [Qipengyuania gelatinilytica]QZD95259.1 hypothetical protein K3136_00575 [Qipengyuania gelatinilytica]